MQNSNSACVSSERAPVRQTGRARVRQGSASAVRGVAWRRTSIGPHLFLQGGECKLPDKLVCEGAVGPLQQLELRKGEDGQVSIGRGLDRHVTRAACKERHLAYDLSYTAL